MKIMKKQITLGIITATRNIFNTKLAIEGRQTLIDILKSAGYGIVILPEDATPTGCIETYSDAKKCADLFRKKRDEIDGVIVTLPNFGDELGVVNALALSDLQVPVLIHAANDDKNKVGVNERRDAFCGKLSVCNNLYQYGIQFTNTSLHTCDLNSEIFRNDLDRFARLCRTVKGLRNARIGAIGARPAAFQTVRFSEKLLQATGITVVPIDLSEIIAKATKMDNQAVAVKTMRNQIGEYGNIPGYIPEENVLTQARFSVVVNEFMEQNDLDASAIQCWDSLEYNYGCASCLTMSMMGENQMPSACEMDVAGAVSMYTLLLASGNAPGFLDWNNNFDYESDTCVCTHCSNYPKSFMGNEFEISNLDILGNTIGAERCFGAIKGRVAPGPFTFFRISTDDRKGLIKSYLGEGEFTAEPYGMDGGIAVCKVKNLNPLLQYMTRNGFEHHVAMSRGQTADIIEEAVGRYLGWDIYRHI
ncbi:fucose isomerase [Marispirochaeta aestuarii]|uniref:L-fucose/L-arabinose isomerase family protein n=1 Tax=Marispirochaeta aestuarii TaxID=1963862 RepID=UPI0029C7D629|nr:fucose isomerase [Marispirochaeta aestuarii]